MVEPKAQSGCSWTLNRPGVPVNVRLEAYSSVVGLSKGSDVACCGIAVLWLPDQSSRKQEEMRTVYVRYWTYPWVGNPARRFVLSQVWKYLCEAKTLDSTMNLDGKLLGLTWSPESAPDAASGRKRLVSSASSTSEAWDTSRVSLICEPASSLTPRSIEDKSVINARHSRRSHATIV